MKSKCHILILLLVSIMIAYVGAGQLVAQCNHTGMVEAVDTHNGCCHKQQKECMTLSVKKISSAVSQQHATVESPTTTTLLPALIPDFFAVIRPAELPTSIIACETEKSPPRQYLNFIQVLLI